LDLNRTKLLDALRKADANAASAPEQRELGTSYTLVGEALVAISNSKDAMYYYRKAFEIRDRLAKENPKLELYQHDLALSLNNLGIAAFRVGNFKDARDFFQKALPIYAQLVTEAPQEPAKHRDFCVAQYNIGSANEKLLDYTEAINWYEKAIKSAAKCDKPETIASLLNDIKKSLANCKAKQAKPADKKDSR
jgi:tetratricopeptide (TPR) repeat protein